VKSAKQLNGATVCVQPGTTTSSTLADYFRANKMSFKPVVIGSWKKCMNAYFAGRCDAFTTDHSASSRCAGSRARTRRAIIILPEIIPRSRWDPAVRHGDDRWFDIVKWSLFAMAPGREARDSTRRTLSAGEEQTTRPSSASSGPAEIWARCSTSQTSGALPDRKNRSAITPRASTANSAASASSAA